MAPAVLTLRAQAALREALRWIAAANPLAARGLNDAVLEGVPRIGANPAIGPRRIGPTGERYRFWSIRRYGYLLVHTDQTQPPRIVRIARDLPQVLADLSA